MTLDQIVHNRIALALGDAFIRKTTFEAEAELLRQEVAALKAEASKASAPPQEQSRPLAE